MKHMRVHRAAFWGALAVALTFVAVAAAESNDKDYPLNDICGVMLGRESVAAWVEEIDEEIPQSFTGLHWAAASGCSNVVIFLLNLLSTMDVNATNEIGQTPFHFATMYSPSAEARQFWTRGGVRVVPDEWDRRAGSKDSAALQWIRLHHAARGNYGVASLLLDAGADASLQGRDGATAPHQAAERDDEEMATLLIQHGADVSAKRTDGATPRHWNSTALLEAAMHLAAQRGHEALVSMLLDAGAGVGAKGIENQTALHHAARLGNCGVANLLLDAGAAASLKGRDGATALHQAAERGHEGMVSLLLDRQFPGSGWCRLGAYAEWTQGSALGCKWRHARMSLVGMFEQSPLRFVLSAGALVALAAYLAASAYRSFASYRNGREQARLLAVARIDAWMRGSVAATAAVA